jgi:hypothetical protein
VKLVPVEYSLTLTLIRYYHQAAPFLYVGKEWRSIGGMIIYQWSDEHFQLVILTTGKRQDLSRLEQFQDADQLLQYL